MSGVSGATPWWTSLTRDVRDPLLPRRAKEVLREVASFADRDGLARPGVARMAADLDVTQRTVLRALEALEAHDYVLRVRRARGTGGGSGRQVDELILDPFGRHGWRDPVADPVVRTLTPGGTPAGTPAQGPPDTATDPEIQSDIFEVQGDISGTPLPIKEVPVKDQLLQGGAQVTFLTREARGCAAPRPGTSFAAATPPVTPPASGPGTGHPAPDGGAPRPAAAPPAAPQGPPGTGGPPAVNDPGDGRTRPETAVVVGGLAPVGWTGRDLEPVLITDVPFAEFWAVWPKKYGRRAAELAWPLACRRAGDPLRILEGARAYAVHCAENPKYPAATAANWLEGMRWEDDPEALPRDSRRTTQYERLTEDLRNASDPSRGFGSALDALRGEPR